MRLLKLDEEWLEPPIEILKAPVLAVLAALSDPANNGKKFLLTGFDYVLPNDGVSHKYFKIFYDFFKGRKCLIRPAEMLALIRDDDNARKVNGWRSMIDLTPQSREPVDSVKKEGWRCCKALRHIFSYNAFAQGRKLKWDSSNLALRLTAGSVECKDKARFDASAFISKVKEINSLSMCPYCNAETIYAERIINSDEKTVRSDLDHFLPMWQYPYFAMSPYNLVPSCVRCNSRLKHDDDSVDHSKNPLEFRYLHPYIEDFHMAAKFQYKRITPELLSGESDDIELDCLVDKEDGARAAETSKAYCLRTVYERIYKRELKTLPLKLRLRESSRINILTDAMDGLVKKRFLRDVVGVAVSEDEIDDLRFGKLSFDLADQISG